MVDILNLKIPTIGFVAHSGTGKTTLLTKLIPILKQSGIRVGLIKHSHYDFEIDRPGKDSFRLREAGASPVMLVSKYRRAIITECNPENEPRLAELLNQFDTAALDLILVEGFKAEHFPKIEVHRASLNRPLLYPEDPDIFAVASDTNLELPGYLTLLELNRPDWIADFIQNYVMKH